MVDSRILGVDDFRVMRVKFDIVLFYIFIVIICFFLVCLFVILIFFFFDVIILIVDMKWLEIIEMFKNKNSKVSKYINVCLIIIFVEGLFFYIGKIIFGLYFVFKFGYFLVVFIVCCRKVYYVIKIMFEWSVSFLV